MTRPSYAVVTPARNDGAGVRRLHACLAAQSSPPLRFVVVDDGSTDDTPAIAAAMAAEPGFTTVVSLLTPGPLARGGPIVRAFEAGLDELAGVGDIVVKVDADVSFDPDYFAILLDRFAAEPALGIASGTCHERQGGAWMPRHVTDTTVWGAARAYRRSCLDAVRPLERRMGWDGIDEFRAQARGFTTRTFADLPFYHHRAEGLRDGSRARARRAQGRAAHYMRYRPLYLVLRAAFHARREPAALAMIVGYAEAAIRREPRSEDPAVLAHVRRRQRLRGLPRRLREARGSYTPG